MSRTTIARLLDYRDGHAVTAEPNESPLFGLTWQPVCLEYDDPVIDCTWRSGFIPNEARARAIAEEHRRKSAGTWRAAR